MNVPDPSLSEQRQALSSLLALSFRRRTIAVVGPLLVDDRLESESDGMNPDELTAITLHYRCAGCKARFTVSAHVRNVDLPVVLVEPQPILQQLMQLAHEEHQ